MSAAATGCQKPPGHRGGTETFADHGALAPDDCVVVCHGAGWDVVHRGNSVST